MTSALWMLRGRRISSSAQQSKFKVIRLHSKSLTLNKPQQKHTPFLQCSTPTPNYPLRAPEFQIKHLHENLRPGISLGISILKYHFGHHNSGARSPQTTLAEYLVVSTHYLPELSSMKTVLWNEGSFLNAGMRNFG